MRTGTDKARSSHEAAPKETSSLVTAQELEDLERASRVLGLSQDLFQRMIDDVQRDAEQAGHKPRWVIDEIKHRMQREYCAR